MAIWYPDSDTTYSQFLQANSFVHDINGQIKTSENAIKGKISDQTNKLVASNSELARTFGRGFDSVNNTIQWGFDLIDYGLEKVSASIDSLRADFNYSIGLLLAEYHTQNKLLTRLLDKMDSIHKTLESPTLTQAREYYHIGCERLSRGLLDKALEAFIEAEKKNDTDFFTQFNIGKLYLYGIDEDDNVLDLKKAKKHLLFAARYAKAEISVDSSFTKLAAEALLHASISIYAQIGEKDVLGDTTHTEILLKEAKELTSESVSLYPQLYESFYHKAKYSALLKDSHLAIPDLETAITADRKYAIKVEIDKAFDPIRQQVWELLTKLKDAKNTESQNKINQANQFLDEVSSWHPEESESLSSHFFKFKDDLAHAETHYTSGTYFGFLDAIPILDQLILALPQFKSQRIEEIKDQVSKDIRDAKNRLPHKCKYSSHVDDLITEANELISQAEYNLQNPTFEKFKMALSLASSAKMRGSYAQNIAVQEDEAIHHKKVKKQRMRNRLQLARKYATSGALNCTILGGISGYINCMVVASTIGSWPTIHLLTGALLGGPIGAIIGGIIGYIKGGLNEVKGE